MVEKHARGDANQPRDAIACFGELLFRLGAPGHETLLQSPRLDVHFGGAEANVAIALARLGQRTRMISVVPDNPLGEAAIGELRRHGVETQLVQRGAGRMGLYFLQTGAMQRPSDVLYDRAGSAFALTDPQRYAWPSLLAGASTLHLSGVTPAISAASAQATTDAASTARTLGLRVVFDGNYRAKLWEASGGDAPRILRGILAQADLIVADQRDIALVLGIDCGGMDADAAAAFAAQAAFAAFPQVQRIASLRRHAAAADRQQLGAQLFTRATRLTTETYPIEGIVDRIGAGDAFVAGLLHGLIQGQDDQASLRFGLATAVLKHAIPGDFIRFGAADVQSLLRAERVDVRR